MLGMRFLLIVAAVMIGRDTLAEESAVVAARALKNAIGTVSLSVTVRPARPDNGLSSVVLYTNASTRLEPDAVWPTGEPVSAHAAMARDQASRWIDILARHGFFDRAGKYYAERRPAAPGKQPPPDAEDVRTAPAATSPGYDIQVSAFDDDWYTIYRATIDSSKERGSLLRALRDASSGEPRRLLSKLIRK